MAFSGWGYPAIRAQASLILARFGGSGLRIIAILPKL
jgi:hypothetical protein